MTDGLVSLAAPWLPPDQWVALGLRLLRALLAGVAIVLAGHVAARVVGRLVDRLVTGRLAQGPGLLDGARATTVRGLLKSAVRYTVDTLVVITVLNAWGVPMGGLLAGAGVAGLAIGFGAQNLVRDVITGFFLLFEDQFRVGDYVEAAGVSGEVVDIGFRVTRIRDWGGQIHTIPNSRFDVMTNYSRGPMRVQVRVKVAYDEDAERVARLLSEVCERFAQESEDMVEGPMVLGMSGLDETGMEFYLWGRAKGGQQWAQERALRMAVKTALDAAGVRGPLPQVVVRRPRETGGGPEPA